MADAESDINNWKRLRSLFLQGSCIPSSEEAYFLFSDFLFACPRLSNDFFPPTAVNHIAQQSTWDCGAACLEMVCNWLEIQVDRCHILECLQTQSVWTADLLRFLDLRIRQDNAATRVTHHATNEISHAQAGARYMFCSRTLSVNDELNCFSYYQQTFDDDRLRVQEIFDELISHGESLNCLVQRHELDIEEIMQLVYRPDCVAIVLLDNAILSGLRCTDDKEFSRTRRDTSSLTSKVELDSVASSQSAANNILYMGHYILILGVVPALDYNDDGSECNEKCDEKFFFQVNNPAVSYGKALLSPKLLDEARKAPGTDQDIIFILKIRSHEYGEFASEHSLFHLA